MASNTVFFTHNIIFICVCRNKEGVFLNKLYKSWELLVALQPPSDWCVVFWINESEKQDIITFCTNLPKKERFFIYENVTWQWPKKDPYKINKMQLQNQSLIFIHKNKSLLSATSKSTRSPMAYITIASLDKLTCTDYVDLANVKTDLDNFLGPKKIPTTWM